MTTPESQEIRALRTIAGRRKGPPKQFTQQLSDLNHSVDFMAEYLIIMQKGIDDGQKDIIQKIQDAIDELIILFNGGTAIEDIFDFGNIEIFFSHLAEIFNIENLIDPVLENPIIIFINSMIADLLEAMDGATGGVFNLDDLADRLRGTEDTAGAAQTSAASAYSLAEDAHTVSAAAAAQADAAYDQAVGIASVAEAAATDAENALNVANEAQLTADQAYENAQYWTNEALVASAQINLGVNELLLGMVMDVPTGKTRKITDVHYAMLEMPGTMTIQMRKTTLAGTTTTIHTATIATNETRKSYNNLDLTVANKDRVFWNVSAATGINNVLSAAVAGVLLDA